jgi:hypothetical protein
MGLGRKKVVPHLPITEFLNQSISSGRDRKGGSKRSKSFGHRTFQQSVLFFLAIAITVSGVAASVAITIKGNSYNGEDNIVSLGVGKAQATSCNNSTAVKVDTISQWDENAEDFLLSRVDVSGVQPSCATHAMTMVIAFESPTPDLTVSCNLPDTSTAFNAGGSFVFPTSDTYTASASQYLCPNFSSGLLMSKIAAAAVEIK